MEMNNDIFTPDPHIPEPVDSEDIPISAPAKDETPAETPPPRRRPHWKNCLFTPMSRASPKIPAAKP